MFESHCTGQHRKGIALGKLNSKLSLSLGLERKGEKKTHYHVVNSLSE